MSDWWATWDSEWKQVFAGLDDFSQYSSWSRQFFSLDDFNSSAYFKFLKCFWLSPWEHLENSQLQLVSPLFSCSTDWYFDGFFDLPVKLLILRGGQSIHLLFIFFYFHLVWTLTILNTSWKQNLTKQQLYSHWPAFTKTIHVRRTRHAEHCWKSRDEHISIIFLWTPLLWQTNAGQPARTYIEHLYPNRMYP